MIIVRTPLRLSFFGGGTDHPTWYKGMGGNGAVLSTSIDKYVYINFRKLPPIFDFKYRISWRILEQVTRIEDIQNPVLREVLRNYAPDDGTGYEIGYNADLPARSGLGSSSSFAVSALHALFEHLGSPTDKMRLTLEAIRVEQDFLKEPVGSQDQTAAAYGGFNRIDFRPDGKIEVDPVDLAPGRKRTFEQHLMMFFTGFTRDASTVEKAKIDNFSERRERLNEMYQMVSDGREILENTRHDLREFGVLLDRAWHAKRALSEAVSNGPIDELYDLARANGAIGGKLLGAGGGGFLIFFAAPCDHTRIRSALANHRAADNRPPVYVPFALEESGSQVIMHHKGGRLA